MTVARQQMNQTEDQIGLILRFLPNGIGTNADPSSRGKAANYRQVGAKTKLN